MQGSKPQGLLAPICLQVMRLLDYSKQACIRQKGLNACSTGLDPYASLDGGLAIAIPQELKVQMINDLYQPRNMHGLCVHLCLFVLRVVVIHAGP